jgi:hypothetical protein
MKFVNLDIFLKHLIKYNIVDHKTVFQIPVSLIYGLYTFTSALI